MMESLERQLNNNSTIHYTFRNHIVQMNCSKNAGAKLIRDLSR